MHILFFSDNFPPEVNAPATRTYDHCREWVAGGHKVTVITCAPNFPKGKIFDGYRNRLWQREEIEGICVIRVWTYVTANEGTIKRTIDYLSFMVSASIASLFIKKVDIIVGTSPQFFTACASHIAGGVKRRPWVFELRDIWPESIKTVGAIRQKRLLDWLEKLELYLYRRSKAIVSVTNSFRRNLVSRGIDDRKIFVVTNGVDVRRFSPRPKDERLAEQIGIKGKFVAGYVGTHGLAHSLDTLLDAAALLKNLPDGNDFHILMLGDGARRAALEKRAHDEGLTNMTFIDTVPRDQVARYWALLDVSIIHLKKDELFKTVIPSKLFECMAMGVPVLHGVEGESAEIVRATDVGLTFEPENAQALVDVLRQLRDDPDRLNQFRQSGPRAVKAYDRQVLANDMLAILKNASKPNLA